MMREILFRGKTKITKNWIYGFYGENTTTKEPQIVGRDEFCYSRVIPETVGQYTGLTDKNGKKIFEGDIVNLELIDGVEIGVIKFNDILCRFSFYDKSGGYGIDNTCIFEIIGNIHDNPELLKGGE